MKVHRCWLAKILFGVLLFSTPSRSGGQVIQGSVLDNESGVPIAGASVMLVDPDGDIATGVLSDSAGVFIMIAPRTGRYVVRCERIGYESTSSAEIDLLPPDTVVVEVRMSVEAGLLAPLTITSPRGPIVMDIRLAKWGFYDRRAQFGAGGTGVTHFLEYEDIKKRNPMRVSDMFTDLQGVRVVPLGGRVSRIQCVTGGRLTFYLDGVYLPLKRDEGIDDYLTSSSLSAIEVYVRGSFPAQYAPRGGCGSVVLWTGWVSGKGGGALPSWNNHELQQRI